MNEEYEAKAGTWIVAFTTDNIHMNGHKAPGFKEACKFANTLWRGGYVVHAIFDEKAYKIVNWEEFEKTMMEELTISEEKDN